MKLKEKIGDFVKVQIDEVSHTYARIIHKYRYAFYDYRTQLDNVDLDNIEKAPILFKLIVHKNAVVKGRWQSIGNRALSPELDRPVPFFIQDIGNKNDCWIDLDGERKKVNPSDCVGVERFAVWDAVHVEKRLKDHYNHQENNNLLALKVRT